MVGTMFNLPRRLWIVLVRWIAIFAVTTITTSLISMLSVMQLFNQPFEPLTILTAIMLPFILGTPVLVFFTIRHQQLKQTNDWLQNLAFTDSMLDCLNRRAFTATANSQLLKATVSAPCALLVVDADDFKKVNDMFGHQQGDQALQIILNAIKAAIRTSDVTGRIGGEEFGILLPHTDHDTASIIAERIRDAIASANFVPGLAPHQLTVSVGIASTVEPSDFAKMFSIADQGLYLAKNAGRNNAKYGTNSIVARENPTKNAAA